jgi:hypothetical protein
MSQGDRETNVLVACICKHDNRKAAEGRNRAFPLEDTDRPPIRHRISLHEMRNNKDDQISN